MRKLFGLVIILLLTNTLQAQDDDVDPDAEALDSALTSVPSDTSYWDKGAMININFSQVGLTNWAGGGNSSISIGALTNFRANYQRDKDAWDNRLDLAYGVLRQGDAVEHFIKTDDNIILSSKYGRKIKENIFISAIVDFRTQFYQGLTEVDGQQVVISKFMAPGFLLANIGATYRYKKIFSATLSPLSSKTTFVNDDSLSSVGSYGVIAGERYRFQGGVNFTSSFAKNLMENVNLTTNLNLFAAYEKLSEIDVNWETALIFKVNKFITSSISTQLIYDEDISSKEIIINEVTGDSRLAPGVQFKSVINVGLTFEI
jgi:hypothetical protein